MKTLNENDLNKQIEDLIDNSEYNKAVELVKNAFSIEFKTEFLRNDFYFNGDKEKRDIYKITLKRGNRKYSFEFGQSINNSGFYAKYGQTKYNIPITLLVKTDAEVKRYVKMNLQFDFGHGKDSIVRPIAPTLYCVLACLEKYEVGSFNDFCDNFGYENDSINAKKTYKAVSKQYDKLCGLFSYNEMETLNLIR
jgi:hypothetical protein